MRAKQVSRLRGAFLHFELGFNLGCGSVMFATEVAPTRIAGTKKPTFVGLCHFQEESGGRGTYFETVNLRLRGSKSPKE